MAVGGAIFVGCRNLRFHVPGGGKSGQFPHKTAVLGGCIVWIESRSMKKIALLNHHPGFAFLVISILFTRLTDPGADRQHRNTIAERWTWPLLDEGSHATMPGTIPMILLTVRNQLKDQVNCFFQTVVLIPHYVV